MKMKKIGEDGISTLNLSEAKFEVFIEYFYFHGEEPYIRKNDLCRYSSKNNENIYLIKGGYNRSNNYKYMRSQYLETIDFWQKRGNYNLIESETNDFNFSEIHNHITTSDSFTKFGTNVYLSKEGDLFYFRKGKTKATDYDDRRSIIIHVNLKFTDDFDIKDEFRNECNGNVLNVEIEVKPKEKKEIMKAVNHFYSL